MEESKKSEPETKESTTKPQQQKPQQNPIKEEQKTSKDTSKSFKPKVPKGARDFTPQQMVIRNKAFNIITQIFQRHGAVEIDTPVFELKQTLMGKYGEESKLIYDLEDQGGELLSLRYDLTVPFASNIKRYHIGKVYRRDQPVMTKGRFREFYQCDFDIAGDYDTMLPEAEVLYIVSEILRELDVGTFTIKISHRKLLDAMLMMLKIPNDKFKTVCSSIDKLDKEPWVNVRKELVEVKGIDGGVADQLGELVKLKGSPKELLEKLSSDKMFEQEVKEYAQGQKEEIKEEKEGNQVQKSVEGENPEQKEQMKVQDKKQKGKSKNKVQKEQTWWQKWQEAIQELSILLNYLSAYECEQYVTLDLSLARGLDYYTGLIYETILQSEKGVGSISAGGRYDELVGMFSGRMIPAVGVSIGIERIFILLEEKQKKKYGEQMRQNLTEVVVGSIGKGICEEKLRLCQELWKNGVKAEAIYNVNPKPQKQLSYALDNLVPFMIWIGENEVKEGVVNLKCLYTGEQKKVERGKVIEVVKQDIVGYYKDLESNAVVFKEKEKKK